MDEPCEEQFGSSENRIPGAYLEDLCFEAQQAAEKAVKAVLISRDIEYPYVHDLARLLSMLEDAGESAPCVVRKAEELTPYALITRYPGPARAVTTPEYLAAVGTAEAVVGWAEGRI